MVLEAVQYVVKTVTALFAVAENTPGEFEVIPGVNKKSKGQLAIDLLKILDEQTFYHEHGCGSQHNIFWNSSRIVEHVFLAGDGMPLFDLPDVINELFVVDGSREVEILNTLCVGFLVFEGFVVVILTDYTQFAVGESARELGNEAGFSGTTASCDSDGEVNGRHTTQT